MTSVQIPKYDWLQGQLKGYILVKYSKIFFSETLTQVKLKLCIHASYISLYINCVFGSSWKSTLVAMEILSSHRIIMGKVEIGNFCCLILYIKILFNRNVY